MILRRHVKFWYLEYSRSAKYKVGQKFTMFFCSNGGRTSRFFCAYFAEAKNSLGTERLLVVN